MNRLKDHPIFFFVIAAFFVVFAAEAWLLLRWRAEAARLDQEHEFRLAELQRLTRRAPAATADNVRAARDDYAQQAAVLAVLLRTLNVVGPDELEYFRGEPPDRIAAYFDIAGFVEKFRQAAGEAQVAIRPDESFGFSSYMASGQGPEPELIRPVYRQRRVIEHLLQKLITARPKELIAVQREAPTPLALASAEGGASAAAAPGASAAPPAASASASRGGPGGPGDFFTIDPQVSARAPGYVDTMAFRLTFTGHTSALRGFMNALATPDIPLVVRSVEVENVQPSTATTRPVGGPSGLFGRAPAAGGSAGAANGKTDASAATVPIVADNVARFTVTVELFEVKIRPPNLAEAAP